MSLAASYAERHSEELWALVCDTVASTLRRQMAQRGMDGEPTVDAVNSIAAPLWQRWLHVAQYLELDREACKRLVGAVVSTGLRLAPEGVDAWDALTDDERNKRNEALYGANGDPLLVVWKQRAGSASGARRLLGELNELLRTDPHLKDLRLALRGELPGAGLKGAWALAGHPALHHILADKVDFLRAKRRERERARDGDQPPPQAA